MELTAQTLQAVTFGAKVRGYDPAEVDDFIAAVAEGVEELQERLRRATERLAEAEASGTSPGGPNDVIDTTELELRIREAEERAAAAEARAAEGGSASASAEVSRIWERAAAAAEAAVAEAQADANRILSEAQAEVDRKLEEAHSQAENERTTAQSEAESTLNSAREEAARLAAESQGQLRAEITQLEQARDQLKSDVERLSSFLESELGRVRETLADALSNIDSRAIGGSTPPEVGEVEVPPLPASMATAGTDSDAGDEDYDQGPTEWDNGEENLSAADSDHGGEAEWSDTPVEEQDEAVEAQPSGQGWNEDQSGQGWNQAQNDQSWTQPAADTQTDEQSQGWGQPQQNQGWGQPQNQSWGQSSEDDENDPFLAELRRAVRDDQPLGPRQSEDDNINSLYANDNPDDQGDDKNGFFRRRK